MKAIIISFAAAFCVLPALAAEPTLEALTRKVDALERQVEELKADLAKAKGEMEGRGMVQNRPAEIMVHIRKDGTIRVEDEDLQDEELIAKLTPLLKKFPNLPIRIRADGAVKYEIVVKVIGLIQQAGIWNISFATEKPQAAE